MRSRWLPQVRIGGRDRAAPALIPASSFLALGSGIPAGITAAVMPARHPASIDQMLSRAWR
jgi:hypothetical protein